MANLKEKLKNLLTKITFKRGVFLIIFSITFSFSLGFIIKDYQQKGTLDSEVVFKIFDILITWLVKLIIFI